MFVVTVETCSRGTRGEQMFASFLSAAFVFPRRFFSLEKRLSLFKRARASPEADSRPIRRQPRDGAATTHEPPSAPGAQRTKNRSSKLSREHIEEEEEIHPLDKQKVPVVGCWRWRCVKDTGRSRFHRRPTG